MHSPMADMNPGLGTNDPAVVVAFRTALTHQVIVAVLIFLLVSVVWAAAGGGSPRYPVRGGP